MIRLVQLQNGPARRIAFVEEPRLHLIDDFDSVYVLAQTALARHLSLPAMVERYASREWLDYDPIYHGTSTWRLLAPIDHPTMPSRCLVSGTGLTHVGSAQNRNAMHRASEAELTDSMRMFRAGLAGGRPATGAIGTAPEWFYKGLGSILRGPGESLIVPPYAEDGGEEAEIAGVYIIDAGRRPWRVGMAPGNEFSDHKYERQNYLHLASSKLRPCSLGPELVVDPSFGSVAGEVAIERDGTVIWRQEISTGESAMCHSLANIEHHHFKFEGHRRPGDVHIHYFGAHSLSCGAGIELTDGDVMSIQFSGFGRALRNPLQVAPRVMERVAVHSLA